MKKYLGLPFVFLAMSLFAKGVSSKVEEYNEFLERILSHGPGEYFPHSHLADYCPKIGDTIVFDYIIADVFAGMVDPEKMAKTYVETCE